METIIAEKMETIIAGFGISSGMSVRDLTPARIADFLKRVQPLSPHNMQALLDIWAVHVTEAEVKSFCGNKGMLPFNIARFIYWAVTNKSHMFETVNRRMGVKRGSNVHANIAMEQLLDNVATSMLSILNVMMEDKKDGVQRPLFKGCLPHSLWNIMTWFFHELEPYMKVPAVSHQLVQEFLCSISTQKYDWGRKDPATQMTEIKHTLGVIRNIMDLINFIRNREDTSPNQARKWPEALMKIFVQVMIQAPQLQHLSNSTEVRKIAADMALLGLNAAKNSQPSNCGQTILYPHTSRAHGKSILEEEVRRLSLVAKYAYDVYFAFLKTFGADGIKVMKFIYDTAFPVALARYKLVDGVLQVQRPGNDEREASHLCGAYKTEDGKQCCSAHHTSVIAGYKDIEKCTFVPVNTMNLEQLLNDALKQLANSFSDVESGLMVDVKNYVQHVRKYLSNVGNATQVLINQFGEDNMPSTENMANNRGFKGIVDTMPINPALACVCGYKRFNLFPGLDESPTLRSLQYILRHLFRDVDPKHLSGRRGDIPLDIVMRCVDDMFEKGIDEMAAWVGSVLDSPFAGIYMQQTKANGNLQKKANGNLQKRPWTSRSSQRQVDRPITAAYRQTSSWASHQKSRQSVWWRSGRRPDRQ